MARTHVKETNAEKIYRNGIERYWIMQIPRTKYCVVSEYNKKNDKWTSWMMDLMAKKKWKIAEEIEQKKLSELISEIVVQSWHNNKERIKHSTLIKELRKRLINKKK